MDIVISARVPEEELELLKKHKINVSEIVRTSIIEAAQQERLNETKKALAQMAPIIKKISKKDFIATVREDRESH